MEDKSKIVLKTDSIVLQQVDYCKYLGVLIDSDLTWQQHVDYIYSKIIKFSGIFYRIRNNLSFETRKMLYYAFIHSHLLYGIEIYANTYHSHLHKLIVLNNKILRILLKVPFDTPVINL